MEMEVRYWKLLLLLVLFLGTTVHIHGIIPRLGTYNVDKAAVTLSGHSSGAIFAHLLHIAHSREFTGVGIFSGRYYERTGHSEEPPERNDHEVGVNASVQTIRKYSKKGLIDNVRYLKDQKAYIYSGLEDEANGADRAGRQIKELYTPFVRNPESQIKLVIKYATHDIPNGNCSEDDLNHDYQCRYNGLQDMFRFLFGSKIDTEITGTAKLKNTKRFDQTEFFDGIDGPITMNNFGRIYVPSGCNAGQEKNECLLHLFFHGCQRGTTAVPKDNPTNKYLFEIAEKNKMIIVFPFQTKSDIDPKGCWDTHGEHNTRKTYATKKGNQIRIVRRIMARVIGDWNRNPAELTQLTHPIPMRNVTSQME